MVDERQVRVDLAACYRLIAHFGWDDLVFTHASARLPGDRFLINPYAMLFDEITASSLVEVNALGRKTQPSEWPVNPTGFAIHSAIHAARPDVGCVVHTHTPAGAAVSAQRDGLLPISQRAAIALSSIAYHDYEGLWLSDDEKPRLVRDLGGSSYLVLRNHGLLTVGRTIAEAFVAMYKLQHACETQLLAQSGGALLTPVNAALIARMGADVVSTTLGNEDDIVWPGLLRRLDRIDPGYRE